LPLHRSRRQLSLDQYVDGVLASDRTTLGQAITLVESENAQHQQQAQQLLLRLLPHTGNANRVGITGVPGVGKSTFIDALGVRLTASGHKVAVLAVDPSSRVSGGSILGDKTRMGTLVNDQRAFVRPSPSGGSLGGVARKTRESMLVCEAAGFDVIVVETVGVGQSETAVAEMVDFFLVLMLAGAGDELQGIKRGLLELADMIAITKADGDNLKNANRARREYTTALQLMRASSPHWKPPVQICSARDSSGLDPLWEQVERHRDILRGNGELQQRRQRQLRAWMWSLVEDGLLRALHEHPQVCARLPAVEAAVAERRTTPGLAARELLSAFGIK